MKCIKCGEEIPDGSPFCNKCGASQEGNNNQSVNNSEQNTVGNPINKFLKMPKNQKSMIIIFVVIMAVITYYINSNNISSQSVNNTYSENSSNISSIIDQSSDDSSIDTNSTYTDENSTYQVTDSSEIDYGTNLNSDSTDSYNLDDDVSEEPVANDEKGACWALAEDVVKANLKSPSSAKFPFSYADEGVAFSKSGNLYTVTGWVDAENSYGAKLRNNFTVTMTKSGYGDNTKFTAESCEID